MKSIICNKKECYICGTNITIEEHHIYYGTSKRKISEKNGFKVNLCYLHHRGTNGVHGKNGHELDLKLKRICQEIYEKTHSREEFMRVIGRNYLER